MAENQETKVEATVNCAGCNKHLRKVKRYYRNGKFFCTKTCWKSHIKKAAEKTGSEA